MPDYPWSSLFDEVYCNPPEREVKKLESKQAAASEVRLSASFQPAEDLALQTHWKRCWVFGLKNSSGSLLSHLPTSVDDLVLVDYPGTDLSEAQIPPTVRKLLLRTCPKLESVRGLPSGQLTSLYLLWARLTSLNSLTEQTQLEHLAVVAPLLTTLSLPSLGPLAGLKDLQSLYLGGIRVEDKSLKPLHGLKRLQRVYLDYSSFSLSEIARLARALPHLPPEVVGPLLDAGDSQLCKECGGPTMILRGAPTRKVFYCRKCDRALIESHELAYSDYLKMPEFPL